MNSAQAMSRRFRAEPVRPQRVLALRLAAVAAGAVVFGALAAPVGAAADLPGAVALAAGFAAAMLAGSAWRVLAAVAAADPARRADATWSGAAAAVSVAALLTAAFATAAGADGARLLAVAGLGLNASYAIARLACLEAGCCRACVGPLAARGPDLRGVEIGATLTILGAAATLLVSLGPAPAALAAFAGHLGVRVASRRARADWPDRWRSAEGAFCEIAPLAAAAVAALVAGLSQGGW